GSCPFSGLWCGISTRPLKGLSALVSPEQVMAIAKAAAGRLKNRVFISGHPKEDLVLTAVVPGIDRAVEQRGLDRQKVGCKPVEFPPLGIARIRGKSKLSRDIRHIHRVCDARRAYHFGGEGGIHQTQSQKCGEAWREVCGNTLEGVLINRICVSYAALKTDPRN